MENDAEQALNDDGIGESEEELIVVELSGTDETPATSSEENLNDDSAPSAEESTGQATMEGNGHDLSALIALICGVIVFLVCASCGLGLYLLPVVAIVLGVIGLIMAKSAVNPQRAQLWSWLGLGSGIITILLAMIGIAVYIILLFGTVKAWGY